MKTLKAQTKGWALAGAAALASLAAAPAARADEIVKWNEVAATAAITTAGRTPPAATLDIAYVHIAMYDAVSNIDRRYRPFAVRVFAPPDASLDAAAATAAHRVLITLFPTQFAFLGTQYAASLAAIPDGTSKDRGIAVGDEVAIRFLEQRTRNGREAAVPYRVVSGPGEYQLTPPAFGPPQVPWMAALSPLAIGVNWRFRAEPPPSLGSARWAQDYDEVKRLGSATSTERTAEQTAIGLFYTEHTGFQYARIFRDLANAQGLGLSDNARLLARIYVASADALTACWDSKYAHNFWRPVTAIRAGDTDGNPATVADPAWTPLAATPGHPEYPSAHSCFTAAWADTVKDFFEGADVPVTLTSTVPNSGGSRSFPNTDAVVAELVDARILGGMHYRFSCEAGTRMGRQVARLVDRNFFKRRHN
jgi:hypothetical protein